MHPILNKTLLYAGEKYCSAETGNQQNNHVFVYCFPANFAQRKKLLNRFPNSSRGRFLQIIGPATLKAFWTANRFCLGNTRSE